MIVICVVDLVVVMCVFIYKSTLLGVLFNMKIIFIDPKVNDEHK